MIESTDVVIYLFATVLLIRHKWQERVPEVDDIARIKPALPLPLFASSHKKED